MLLSLNIQMLQTKFNKEVFAVVTDNENKMVKMKELIKRKYPNVITYGCSAHFINLMEKEVSHPDVLKHIVEVQKFFRYTHQPHVSLFYFFICFNS